MQGDVLLVHQTLAGDELAFGRLVRKYYKPIYIQMLSIVGNAADAEELTDDAFVKAYLNLGHLRQFSSFYNWLCQIARHHCQNWLRQHRESYLSLETVSDEIETDVSWNSIEDRLIQQERLDRVLEAIESLPEIDKSLMQDFYLEEVPYKTLQQRYHLSKAAVKMRLFKARQKIREQVKDLLPGVISFPWQNVIKKLFVGVIELMKISVKTKLVAAGTAALLTFGGIGILVWRSHQPEQELSKPVVSRAGQTAPASHRLFFDRPFNKTPDEQDTKPQIDESTARPDPPEEHVEMTEVEELLAFLDKMDEFGSSEETVDPEEGLLRLFGLTRAEIEATVPVLEEEIKTETSRIIFLSNKMMDFIQSGQNRTDPDTDKWCRETDRKMKRAWRDLVDSKIRLYISYRIRVGDAEGLRADMAEGGWLHEMQYMIPSVVRTITLSPLRFSGDGEAGDSQ
jgi:RNA polymerase sigma-70 factor (ECF subfamily)